MYLGPHHFQVQSRYFEDSIRFATSSVWFEPHGLVGCRLDAEALRNGTLAVLHARGIFSDGLPFQMPESDALPEPRHIAEIFPPTRDRLTVFLAIPARRPQGVNCLAPEELNGQAPRYIARTETRHDDNTGRDEKPVRLGRKNIRLLLDIEPADGYTTLPIARVMRDGAGHFIFDESFIPPCVQISASDRIMFLLQRLVEILEDKSATLAPAHGAGKGWAEYSTRDIANFWFRHTVNSALVPLRHLFLTKHGHPEELYYELARLAGALCTFAIDSHPRAVPHYRHLQLDETFDALDHHIRTHLETIAPTNCVSIPLAPAGDYFYEGQVGDARCLDRARWFLAISSPIGEVELISRTPQLVKICSKLFVPELVKRALPGMALTHVPVPPSAISTRVDTQYFSVNRAGPCWDHIVQTKQIGVYVPGDLPNPTLELLVVLES